MKAEVGKLMKYAVWDIINYLVLSPLNIISGLYKGSKTMGLKEIISEECCIRQRKQIRNGGIQALRNFQRNRNLLKRLHTNEH